MTRTVDVLALAVARGGSKGIPRKNILPVGGRPLIAWTLAAARASLASKRVVVSTEDRHIAETALLWGADAIVQRPLALAQDDTPTMPVVMHALAQEPYGDLVVLLQPTSPLRTGEDIDACIRLCIANGGVAVVSVAPTERPVHHIVRLGDDGTLTPLLEGLPSGARRQDLPPAYALNGAVYVASREWLAEHGTFVTAQTQAYVMPRERSIDIDDPLDLEIADILLRKRREVERAA